MLPPSPPTDPDVQISRIRFLTGELRSGGISVNDPGSWQRVAVEERVEACPGEPLRTRATFQPFVPRLRDLLAILAKPPDVSRDAVIGIMTDEGRRQPGVLLKHRPVPVGPTPVRDDGQRAGKAVLSRRLPHHVLALLRLDPTVGEAEKVERSVQAVCRRTIAALRAEVDEARLVGMQRQPKPSKAFAQHFQHPLGVVVGLESHHEVIGKPHQGRVPAQARSHLFREPPVQHMVQEDVRQDR
jgi:hypothetical protein